MTPHRRIALRTFATALVLLTLASLVVRAATRAVEARNPGSDVWGTARVEQALEALPVVAARDETQVLLFGSSNLQNNLQREALEAAWSAAGARATALNFGFGGIDGEVQRLLAERVVEAYARHGHRLAVAVLELDPSFLTTRRSSGPFARRYDQFQAIVSGPRDFAAAIARSPEHGVRIAAYRIFLGGISPAAITARASGVLRARFLPHAPDTTMPQAWRLAMARAAEAERRAEPAKRYWALERDGFPPASPELEAALADAARVPLPDSFFEADVRFREECCDAVDMRIDEEALSAFILAVRDLAGISRRAVLFVSPPNRAFLVSPPEAEARLAAALARVSEETGVALLALPGSETLGREDYLDSSHLNVFGARKLSTELGAALAPLLLAAGSS